MVDAQDIEKFLTTAKPISRLNFAFLKYKVYPKAYTCDVVSGLRSKNLTVRNKKPKDKGARASYDVLYDSFDLPPNFDLTDWKDQAYLIHECTHAHLDIQSLGDISGYEFEAVAYLAEAVFLEAQHRPPLGTRTVRNSAHVIAKKIIGGVYWVPDAEANVLVEAVKKTPGVIDKAVIKSNGYKRGFIHQILK